MEVASSRIYFPCIQFKTFDQPKNEDLAASGIREVPAVFKLPSQIQDSCSSCSSSNSSDDENNGTAGIHEENSVAVIDLSDLLHQDSERRASVVVNIRSALEEWGFFQVVNHGVPTALMDEILRVYKLFFELPLEEKTKYYTTDPNPTFRFGVGRITPSPSAQNWKDFAIVRPGRDLDKLSAHPPTFREVTVAYNNAMIHLKRELLNALSESLGLSPSFIDDVAGEGEQFFVCNFYPPCPEPKVAIGASSHSDFGTITTLLQDDVGGLEILDKHNNWIQVKPLRHALVINAGDQLEVFTNGKYRSVSHRVRVNPDRCRISIPSFISPLPRTYIAPSPSLVGEEGPLYKGDSFRDYLVGYYANDVNEKLYIESIKLKPSGPLQLH
ncbi:unnamed protein product [Sphagnum troendelagicum]|uniref:Fe2OG dioxygenase domain-containing protein n=1 Tax=Sphagnum troendelagicum TaxID=128251 RepID=A0ABP0V319_9BRYO